MKKKRKYQNQQISLNQNIHIKYYLNFLTFFFISGFRLKYYYNYMNYYKLFNVFSRVLGFTLRSNYLLKAIMLPNFFCFKLFKNYGSYNLNKFMLNKNLYGDSNFQFFFNKKNKIQNYSYKSFILNNRNFSIIKNNDNNLILYNNILLKNNELKESINYFVYLEFFSTISFLIFSNNLSMYKFYLYIALNINFK